MTESRPQGQKWSCECCTYENWPAAKRCTLCRASRRPQYIIEDVPLPKEQDIYKMASLVSPSTSLPSRDENSGSMSPTSQLVSGTGTSGGSVASNKWACQVCTYLNWPKSQKCTQCLSVRPKVVPIITPSTTSSSSPSISSTSTSELSKPLSISVNIEGAGIGYGTRNSPRTSPRQSPNSPEAAKAINNDRNRAMAVVTRSVKWTCKACTFDNWPKATKCTLCGVLRGKTTLDSSPQGSRSSSSENLAGASSDVNRRSGRRRSPPSSCDQTRDIQQLAGATAASTSLIGSNDPKQDTNKKLDDRRFRQFRNRLRDSDWLWLNACQGVVEGDFHAVEAFLASGGDPGRQLTQDESSFLNRPSAFQSGYTLVHLAIRFQREDMLAALLTSADVVAKVTFEICIVEVILAMIFSVHICLLDNNLVQDSLDLIDHV